MLWSGSDFREARRRLIELVDHPDNLSADLSLWDRETGRRIIHVEPQI